MTYATAQAVLDAYVEGTRRLDRDMLASCFHGAAVMSGDLAGQLLVGSPAPFLDDVAGMAAAGVDHSALRIEIGDLVVTGRTASATVRSWGFGARFDFVDRFHLIEGEAGWAITSKSFTTL